MEFLLFIEIVVKVEVLIIFIAATIGIIFLRPLTFGLIIRAVLIFFIFILIFVFV